MNDSQNVTPRVCSRLITVLTVIAGGLLAAPTYGQFDFDPTVNVNVGPEPGGAAVGDLDGDGDIDLATGIRFPDRVIILLNDGDGDLQWARPLITQCTLNRKAYWLVIWMATAI